MTPTTPCPACQVPPTVLTRVDTALTTLRAWNAALAQARLIGISPKTSVTQKGAAVCADLRLRALQRERGTRPTPDAGGSPRAHRPEEPWAPAVETQAPAKVQRGAAPAYSPTRAGVSPRR